MDWDDFCHNWLVIAGKTPEDPKKYHVRIKKKQDPNGRDEDAYEITYTVNGKRTPFEQTLYPDCQTHTLNSRPRDGKPQRCVALWRRPVGRKACIFAMWVSKGNDEDGMTWEVGDNGSWGAEAG